LGFIWPAPVEKACGGLGVGRSGLDKTLLNYNRGAGTAMAFVSAANAPREADFMRGKSVAASCGESEQTSDPAATSGGGMTERLMTKR
jgi:hypothetical protein